MYVVGGCENKYECVPDAYYIDLRQFLGSGQVRDIAWQRLEVDRPELIRRWGHTAVVKDDKATIFGGRCDNKDLQNFVQLDLRTGRCQELRFKGPAPRGRRKPGFCLRNNTLFCFSGFDGSYLRDFFYLNLLSKPTFPEPSGDNAYFEGLKEEFIHCQPEEFDFKFESKVINLELFEYETCLSYLYANVTAPLAIRGFPGRVCGCQFSKRSKYFTYLLKSD
jgi:hypothetical protein